MFDWIQPLKEGLYIAPADCWIDPKRSVPRAVITHAHGDHFKDGHREVYATLPTFQLAAARHGARIGKITIPVMYQSDFQIGPVTFRLLPAGHIPGSAQIFVSYADTHVLITGDYAMSPTLAEPLVQPHIRPDLVVTECTFGEKAFHQNPTDALGNLLSHAAGHPLIIGAYAIGKAQRITAMLRECGYPYPILIQDTIIPFHRVYERLGYTLGTWEPYRRKIAGGTAPMCTLVTPSSMSGFADRAGWISAIASGWDFRERQPWVQHHLDISDHASAEEIKAYLLALNPAEVWLVHGYAGDLPVHLQNRGIQCKTFTG